MKISIPNSFKILHSALSSRGFNCRIVGGYVRDAIQNIKSNEIDVATNALPQDVMNLDLKTIPTGIAHGTVTVFVHNECIEVTTLRRDLYCDGRHASVEFTDDWEQDAMRRDFTINAMYADVHGEVYDFLNGINDLQAGIVRFIGCPETRIHEDYLRILRYFRFLGYFEKLSLDDVSYRASLALADNLNKISHERIRSELLKTLSSTFPSIPMQLVCKNDILKVVGLQMRNINNLWWSKNAIINLAAILKVSNMNCMKHLKFLHNHEKKFLQVLLRENNFHECFNNIMQYGLYDVNVENYVHRGMQEVGKNEYIALFQMYFVMYIRSFNLENVSDVWEKCNKMLQKIILMKFPLNGYDIINLGFREREIGTRIAHAKRLWLNSNCTLRKDDLIILLQDVK